VGGPGEGGGKSGGMWGDQGGNSGVDMEGVDVTDRRGGGLRGGHTREGNGERRGERSWAEGWG